jgi:DNA-binding CsgD family transcriptional regulator
MVGKHSPILSERQKQVLCLIDRRLTIKEIAGELGISETRVNQHIDTLKRRLNANTHRELAACYQTRLAAAAAPPLRMPTGGKSQLPGGDEARSSPAGADSSELTFADAHAFSVEAPWTRASEPRVVPPALDGQNAVLLRLALIAAMVFGILASLVLAITAADSVTQAVGGRPERQQTG